MHYPDTLRKDIIQHTIILYVMVQRVRVEESVWAYMQIIMSKT